MSKTKTYGIWNLKEKRYVFNIKEDSKIRAKKELQRKIGNKAFDKKYVVKPIPDHFKNPENKRYSNFSNNKHK